MEISVKFGYIIAKELAGFSSGATGWWGVRVAKFYGHAPERLCPTVYEDNRLEEDGWDSLPFEAFRAANQFRDAYYQRLYTIEDFMHAINTNMGCQIEFDLYEHVASAPMGKLRLPQIGEKHLGSHSVFVYGYNTEEQNKYLYFLNSWGEKWGDKGRGYIPFDYFDHGLINAGWSTKHSKMSLLKPKIINRDVLKTKTKEEIRIVSAWYPPLRKSEYKIAVFDIYSEKTNFLLGCIHISPINDKVLEVEELFVLPQYNRKGVGSEALKYVEKFAKNYGFEEIIGWVGAQDLVQDREEVVLNFFVKNGYSLSEDDSRFKDAVYRFSKRVWWKGWVLWKDTMSHKNRRSVQILKKLRN